MITHSKLSIIDEEFSQRAQQGAVEAKKPQHFTEHTSNDPLFWKTGRSVTAKNENAIKRT